MVQCRAACSTPGTLVPYVSRAARLDILSVSPSTVARPGCGLTHNGGVGMPRVRRRDLDILQLTEILTDDQACRDLRFYFGIGRERGELPPYTGGRFELLDGGGDRTEVCDRF